jgi:hypothetical protein
MELLKAKNPKRYEPGEKCPVSGIYETVSENGQFKGRRATVVEKEPFPPTDSPGYYYILVVRTNPKK